MIVLLIMSVMILKMVRTMLKENTLANISYHKITSDKKTGIDIETGEYTHRVIIPTYVPQPKNMNVKGIDVTDLTETDAEALLGMWQEYQTYLNNQRKTLFAFDEFIEHVGGTSSEIKWRTFKPAQLEVLK